MTVQIKHKEVGDHVEMPKEEFERVKATIETLEDQDVVQQLVESEKAKKDGRVREWKDVKDDLAA